MSRIRRRAFSRMMSESPARLSTRPLLLRDPVPFVGRDWAESVIYELHVGTFSPEGTYAGVENKLFYLKELGVHGH